PGVEEYDGARAALGDPDAQLGLFAAHGAGAETPDAGREPAEVVEDLPAERHVAADEVPHRRGGFGHTPVGTAHHPVELAGEPTRPALRPIGLGEPADANHS